MEKVNKKGAEIALFVISVIALLLRLVNLASTPFAFFEDVYYFTLTDNFVYVSEDNCLIYLIR